jgi:hypothetical protein
MSQVVRRVPGGLAPSGAEISEQRLAEMIDALQASAGDPVGGGGGSAAVPARRRALRLPVGGFVMMVLDDVHPTQSRPHFVGVYDMSRTGIAVVDAEPLPPGARFRVLFARATDARPLEVACTVRHCRPQGDGYIIGAEFGTSWVSATGAQVAPIG